MYDPPALRWATDRWWRALRSNLERLGLTAPEDLDRVDGRGAWTDPGLVLSQTCGYPLVTALGDTVAVVGVPVFDAPGCEAGRYRSRIIVGGDGLSSADGPDALADLKGRRVAVNGPDSQSGMNALQFMIAPLAEGGGFFGTVIRSGSHRDSVRLVAAGQADCAAIDAVTFQLLADTEPGLTGAARTLGWTEPAVFGLPYITAAGRPANEMAALRQAITDALEDPDPELVAARRALHLTGFRTVGAGDYAPITSMIEQASARGYDLMADGCKHA